MPNTLGWNLESLVTSQRQVRSGLATIVDHDAEPQEWATAIVTAAQKEDRPELPAEYGLDRHVEAWARVVGQDCCKLKSGE